MAWAAPSTCWAWLLSGGCLLCRRTGFLGGYLLQEQLKKNGSPGPGPGPLQMSRSVARAHLGRG